MKLHMIKWALQRLFSKGGLHILIRKTKRAFSVLLSDGPRGIWILTRQNLFRMKNDIQAEKIMPSGGMNDGVYVAYDSEYQADQSYNGLQTDVKPIAFYLPQFHTFPENDEWWGKGFTEWNNTRACTQPRFEGHYQPREPHEDIGFYDLSDFEVMRKQVALAKRHGIYGFCFYYYWFSGKRLMEKPVDQLLEHPEVDMPFCLCWANENWTRAWDGQNRNILIKQQYSQEDNLQFILDMKRYLDDSRYIRIDGKPVVIVYNPGQIPDAQNTFEIWREQARKLGIGEILIWTCATSNNSVRDLKLQDAVDGEVEFPPHNMWFESIGVHGLDLHGKSALIYNYQKLVQLMETKLAKNEENVVPLYHACTMGWDNSARRKENWFTLYAYSTRSFYRWLRALVKNARATHSESDRFIFINAWNEWAEGTYLEPDRKYGYTNINTVSKAIFDLPYDPPVQMLTEKDDACKPTRFDEGPNCRIAVHMHLFYVELMEEMIQSLNQLPYQWDLFISTDTEEKKNEIEKAFRAQGHQNRLNVAVSENRGRDVRPFLEQMRGLAEQYEYIGHLHGKRTKTGDYGGEWRKYCLRNLFGTQTYLERLFQLFEQDETLGLIFPATFPPLMRQAEWGGNKEQTQALLHSIGCETPLPQEPVFPVGNMFWARSQAILPVINRVCLDDFPEEAGQVNATLAHCIERCWVYVARSQGYGYRQVMNACAMPCEIPQKKRLALYVHFDAKNVVSEADQAFLRALKEVSSHLLVISNSLLPKEEEQKLHLIADDVLMHENHGYDFAAWRDAFKYIGWKAAETYDEVILTNNSILGPYYPLHEMFAEMEKRDLDFWGPSLFPLCPDGSYLSLPYIPEHLQSFFLAFRQNVVKSEAFHTFWERVEELDDLKKVVAAYESQLTQVLARNGFSYQPYLLETQYMDGMLGRSDMPYTKPWIYLLMRFPFLKKKYPMYISDEDELILRGLMKSLSKECC